MNFSAESIISPFIASPNIISINKPKVLPQRLDNFMLTGFFVGWYTKIFYQLER